MKSCKSASFLMSKQLDTPLTTREKLALKVHLMMCRNCSRCNEQLQFLHSTCNLRYAEPDESSR